VKRELIEICCADILYKFLLTIEAKMKMGLGTGTGTADRLQLISALPVAVIV